MRFCYGACELKSTARLGASRKGEEFELRSLAAIFCRPPPRGSRRCQRSVAALFAAEPLKVGFIFLGPIGDYGWTWAHDKGRLAMDAALKGQIVSSYVENVKEDASAVPILKDLAQNGPKLIFTTSYGYMDQTIEVAKQFPDVKFEHCTGYKHADNVGTYNSRFHQGRAVEGTIAGLHVEIGHDRLSRLLQGAGGRARGEFRSRSPRRRSIRTSRPSSIMIDSWFDPAKEAAAVQTLINLGCDVVAQHTDSPAGLQVCEKSKVWCFGQGADMSRFAPKTQATAIEDIWGPYYISRAKAMLDGSWKSDDAWWGLKEGTVVMSPYNKALPDNVKAAADKIIAGWKDGSYDVFTGPIRTRPARSASPRAAHGRQRPCGDRLVRQRRAELSLRALQPPKGEAPVRCPRMRRWRALD